MSHLAPLPIVVLGPTGSGKSELAIQLARNLAGEIVNFDSVQVYRHLNVGSAKLPPHERQGIPHHLLDILSPTEELTAGAYARHARLVLAQLAERKTTAILVGGTGFYLRALLHGLAPAPGRDVSLRQKLQIANGKRPLVLHRYLRRLNPAAAERIHPNDIQKLIRAVEISTLGCSQAAGEPGASVQALKIGLCPNRVVLNHRLDERSAFLFGHGLLEETKELLAMGLPPENKVFTILGYRQALQVLTGSLSTAAALTLYQTRTRQYAKRQMTWFRKEPHVHWLAGFGSDPIIQAQALEVIRQQIGAQTLLD